MASTRINLTVDETAKDKALELFKAFGMDACTVEWRDILMRQTKLQ